ncbi:MAG: fasciclin domain-containing protein [Lewinella sp.]
MKKIPLLLLALTGLIFSACGGLDDDNQPPQGIDDRPILEIMDGSPEFSTFVEALTQARLDLTISGGAIFTVFAPTNAAFAASGLDLNTVDSIELENILRYHLQAGVLRTRASFLEGQLYVSTANTDSPDNSSVQLFVERLGDDIQLNGSTTVENPQILGNNGIIHPIDQVLFPPTVGDMIRQNSLLSEFSALFDEANPLASGTPLLDSLTSGNLFTVFAPINSEFMPNPPLSDAQLLEVLLYHIVGGRSTRFNDFPGTLTTLQGDQLLFTGRTVRTTSPQSLTLRFEDIQATNGILHLVSEVMLPAGL